MLPISSPRPPVSIVDLRFDIHGEVLPDLTSRSLLDCVNESSVIRSRRVEDARPQGREVGAVDVLSVLVILYMHCCMQQLRRGGLNSSPHLSLMPAGCKAIDQVHSGVVGSCTLWLVDLLLR